MDETNASRILLSLLEEAAEAAENDDYGILPDALADPIGRAALSGMEAAALGLGARLTTPQAPGGETVLREKESRTVIKEKVVGIEFSGSGAQLARMLRPGLKQEEIRLGPAFTGGD